MRLFSWCIVAAIAGGATASADWPEIKSRGTLRVTAYAKELAEIISLKPGTEPGFDRELIEGFARLHRLKAEIAPVQSWDERIPALLRGDADLIIGLVDTPERRKQVAFTDEVIPIRHLAVSCRPQSPVDTVEAFRSARVGIVKGSSWAQAAAEAGATIVQSYDTLDQALDALCAGKITATVTDFPDFALSTKRYSGLDGGVFLGPPTSAGWGIRKTDPELKRFLDEYLENVRKSGSHSRLIVKYFGDKALSVLQRAREK